MKVYVVTGSSYDGYEESAHWVVNVFATLKLARQFVRKAQDQVMVVLNKHSGNSLDASCDEDLHKVDPHAKLMINYNKRFTTGIDYTIVTYQVIDK